MLRRIAAACLLALACRSAPSPAPTPSTHETQADALARCARKLPGCRYLSVVPHRDERLAWCDDRGVSPAPGDPCHQRQVGRAKNEGPFDCWCDECRSSGECPQPGYCAMVDPCRGTPFRCFTGAPPTIEGCPNPSRVGAPVP